MDFLDLPDLAARKYGGSVLYANDDFFAEKENLLKPEKAIFIDGKYTDRGKWMDGWESRRRRVPGHDFCIVRLGLPGVLRGVVVDTAFFKGNFPQACSLEGISLPGQPTVEELLADDLAWVEVLPKSDLRGDSENLFAVDASARFTHLRFHIYPDGGVARLRVHGDVVPDPRWMGRPGAEQEVDLAAVEHGAEVIATNDMFFGSRHNLIGPGRAANMGDGWETKRSRREGPDWVVVRLAAPGEIHRALVDTLHFKGNFPESCALHVTHVQEGSSVDVTTLPESAWTELLPRTKLQAHTLHAYEEQLRAAGPATHVRMRIWPDGGVSRLRLFGHVSGASKERQALRFLNAVPSATRERMLRSTCGSSAFVKALAARAPFTSFAALSKSADEVFATLGAADLDEAFSAHPRIGETRADAQAMGEQAQVASAQQATLDALAAANAAYEQKFGRIYIVCASGKSAEEMLALAKTRMTHDAKKELQVAAEEQRQITQLRLAKLVRRA